MNSSTKGMQTILDQIFSNFLVPSRNHNQAIFLFHFKKDFDVI